MARKIEEYNGVLVVEGYGDLLFYAEVLEFVGKHPQVFIKELGGNFDLLQKLETLITPALLAKKDAMAFIFDADEKPEAKRKALQDLLSKLTGQQILDGQWSERKQRDD